MTGLALIRQCLKNNVKIIAFVRPDSKNAHKLPVCNLITPVISSLENIGKVHLPYSCSRADVFYHIGWINNTKEKRNSCHAQAENIPCAIDTVHLAKKMECSRYIYLGSQAEIGLSDEPVTANGIAKYAAGKMTSIECKVLGLEHIWVRLLSEYGPNDHEDRLVKQFIRHCRDNKPMDLGDCNKIWDYLYEDDAGAALYLIGLKGYSNKIYALGSGDGRPLKEYLEIIKNKINPDYQPNYGALKNIENDISYLRADISELKKDTGWCPKTSFDEGINFILKELI